MSQRWRPAIAAFGVFAGYAATTFVLTFPLFREPSSTLIDPEMKGVLSLFSLADIYAILWVMAWDVHALTTAPLSLFDANIFHPASRALTSTEHMLGHVPLFGPVYALTGNPILANQANLFVALSACGASMYALLRSWQCARLAAFGGGLVFAYFPLRLHLLAHAHLVAGFYFVLALLALDRALIADRRRWLVAFSICLGLQCLCSFYLAYMSLIALAAYLLAVVASRERPPADRMWAVGLAALLAIAPFLILATPYLASRAEGTLPTEQAAELLRYLSVRLHRLLLVRAEGYYVGLVVVALSALGLLAARRQRQPAWARSGAAAIALSCAALSLGPAVEPLPPLAPYDLAVSVIPGFSAMRAPSRFVLFIMIGLASLAGMGLDALSRAAWIAGRWRPVAVVAAIALIVLDYSLLTRTYAVRAAEVGDRLPPVYRALATLPAGAVIELPGGGRDDAAEQLRESLYTYRSTFHWQPLLNGRAGYEPPSYPLLMALARALPDARALELLQRMAGVRYVVVHGNGLPRASSFPGTRSVGRFGAARLFEVERVVAADLRRALLEPQLGETVTGAPLRLIPRAQRRVRIRAVAETRHPRSGTVAYVALEVENSGATLPVLTYDDALRVDVGCRWRGLDGEVRAEIERADRLPFDLRQGEKVRTEVACRAGVPAGAYDLEIGLTQAGEWFDGGARVRVEVR